MARQYDRQRELVTSMAGAKTNQRGAQEVQFRRPKQEARREKTDIQRRVERI